MSIQTTARLPVAIIGGGFSGTLLAINLLRQGARVVLIERQREKLARGLAYQTRQNEHLLNVRASNMSAYADEPDHFLRWLGPATPEQGVEQGNRFVPRATYGRYLREQLLHAMGSAPGRLHVKEQEAVAIDWADHHADIALDSGERVKAAQVVLAQGNIAPQPLPILSDLPADLAITDPWSPRATKGLSDEDHILLVGTGLTMIDVIMSLESTGWQGRITAISRRGLLPRVHADTGPATPSFPRPADSGSWLLHHIRARARDIGWHQAVDELRPHAQNIWRLHDVAAQARFLRHARPWWDVHRHRMAPQVAQRIAAIRAEGRLTTIAGRITAAQATSAGVQITIRPRHQSATQDLAVTRIITCTGPESDITRAPDPLLASLLAQGRARPDVHHMGLDVDHVGHLIDTTGNRQQRLFAVGPMTKGEAWETVAVPDIRRQVWHLARAITGSHWTGGEGL